MPEQETIPMKRIVFITLLVALLISAVSATAGGALSQKTALSCESPAVAPAIGSEFDITGILTSGISSTPVPNRLIAVYNTSADGKKWTMAGFAYTGENGQYTVTTSQPNRGIYNYKAVFEGDKIFKKVTSPTIPVTVTAAGSGYHSPLYGFHLQNLGYFVTKLACYYSTDDGVTWHESDHTKGIAIENWGVATLGDLGVPEGALVKIHAIVVAGKDRTGSEVFQYYYTPAVESHHYAEYWIYGSTFNPDLDYEGYRCCML